MDTIIFSLNATMPLIFVVALGFFFRKIGLFGDSFTNSLTKFVFKAALPANLFYELANEDFLSVWDTRFALFCFSAGLACIVITILISGFLKDGSVRGEFSQASFRASVAILGIVFIENIYGDAGMAPLMIAAFVPVTNIMSVVVLEIMKPGSGGMNGALLRRAFGEVFSNPIFVGVMLGFLWSVLRLPRPQAVMKTVKYLSDISSPLALMAMGASLSPGTISKDFGAVLASVFLKLVFWCAIFLPIAIYLGFTHDKLIAILAMLGSPASASCYVMSRNMGHEGAFSSSAVMLSTLLSALTLTGWICLLYSMGLL